MISKEFQFIDPSERYYSSVNQERFYEVISNHQQLPRLLLLKHSLNSL